MTAIKAKPFYKKAWFWVAIVLIVVILTALLTFTVSYDFLAWCLRLACEPKDVSTPNNYDEICAATVILAQDVVYDTEFADGVLDIIAPKDADGDLPLIVYIHGGYYVGGDKSGKEPYCRTLASNGYVVANLNYALAPEAKYPTQLIQVNTAIGYLTENADTYGIDTNSVFIGGDSAGAHLASMLGAYYTNDALAAKIDATPCLQPEQLSGLLLLCGMYDMDTVRSDNFPFLPAALWMLTGERYFEDYSRLDELNTIKNVTSAYPPTFLLCGDKDPFISQAAELNRKLYESGIYHISYLPTSGANALKHEFQCDFSLDEAYTAMQLVIEFLNTNC